MIERVYSDIVENHLKNYRQMAFLMGPRQVGKTTLARKLLEACELGFYFNWDNRDHRQIILEGQNSVADYCQLERLHDSRPLIVFDEIHKWGKWKDFLKGFFDTFESDVQILVTGSARLDVFRQSGDSLMGRYFGYQMHPLSVGEIASSDLSFESLTRSPSRISEDKFDKLLKYGGFPEPYKSGDSLFYKRWTDQRTQLLFKEELRELSRIRELGQVEILYELVRDGVGSIVNYSNFSRDLDISNKTVKRWLETLKRLYVTFSIKPWHKSVKRALRKRPKYYLWDWSRLAQKGQRAENFIAASLLKATDIWCDAGLGDFELRYIRDKQKNEVDFAVIKNDKPWLLVEVKHSASTSLPGDLERFQSQTDAPHALEVAIDADFVNQNCFELGEPRIVPAKTFLSQIP